MKKFKLIDLFCGAGGKTIGFVDPRFCGAFESIFAVDFDQDAINTYNENFGAHGIMADIEEVVNQHEIPKADIVIGGPPCQGFSLLNKNRKGDSRRALWQPYMDIVELSGAKCFVMENVQGLLKSQEFKDIKNKARELVLRPRN